MIMDLTERKPQVIIFESNKSRGVWAKNYKKANHPASQLSGHQNLT